MSKNVLLKNVLLMIKNKIITQNLTLIALTSENKPFIILLHHRYYACIKSELVRLNKSLFFNKLHSILCKNHYHFHNLEIIFWVLFDSLFKSANKLFVIWFINYQLDLVLNFCNCHNSSSTLYMIHLYLLTLSAMFCEQTRIQ